MFVIHSKKVLSLLVILWPFLMFSQTKWAVTATQVDFFIFNAGIEVDGTLGGFTGDIQFSPGSLSDSEITASLKPSTNRTGIDARDNSLQGEEYFLIAAHPTISMTSASFRRTGSKYLGVFKLTIKGATKRIEMPFTFEESNGQATFSGSFTIDRLEFGVGESSWFLSNEVRIELTANATKI